MAKGKWSVVLPHGRWMGGVVHHFQTKAKAEDFVSRWNSTENNSGSPSVTFWRDGQRYRPVEDQ